MNADLQTAFTGVCTAVNCGVKNLTFTAIKYWPQLSAIGIFDLLIIGLSISTETQYRSIPSLDEMLGLLCAKTSNVHS